MIRNIELENCFSFLEATSLSFGVTNKAPTSKKYQQSIVQDERYSKVLGIVGPNGSGKSNFLRVLSFLKWFILDSFGQKPDSKKFPLRPFIFKEKPFDPSKISIEFEYASKVYRYKVILQGPKVLSEELHGLDLSEDREVERKRFKQLFSRNYDSELNEYKIESHAEFALSEGIRDIVKKRTNASLLSAAIFSNHSKSLELKTYWESVVPKIKQFGRPAQPIEFQIFEAGKFYHKNSHHKARMEELMSKCDLGMVGVEIERMEVLQPSGSKEEVYAPWGMHLGIGGKSFKLPFPYESSGTQQIYILLMTLLPVLENGGLAIVDELEADLHPELLPALLDLFVSPKTNSKAAQLIFTCHATPLLNALDKYQIVIVEKGQEGISELWRLDELEGVRNDDNFFAKYSSGSYGGIPQLGKLDDVTE